jgi:hypothetical protein
LVVVVAVVVVVVVVVRGLRVRRIKSEELYGQL